MAYFANRAVNLLNLHYAIHAITLGSGAFFLVYVLKAGVSVPGALAALAAVLAGRFVLRPAVVPLAVRIGIRRVLITGTIFLVAQFPLISEVQGLNWAFFASCVVWSVGDTLYWTSYHAYFAALGDHEHRGHQVSAREAVVAIIGIVSPLATGWALVTFGARIAFNTAGVIQFLSAAPLLWTPDIPVAREVRGAVTAAWPGVLLFVTDGWIAAGFIVTWQIVLFYSVGENFLAFGGALAAAALAGSIIGLVLGRHIDAGHGRRAVWLAIGALVVTIVLRAAAAGDPYWAVAANALGALVTCLYTPTLMTAVYNLSKRSPCPLRFHVATEGGWDVGGAVACLIIALMAGHGVPLAAGVLLALAGAVSAFILLRRYYVVAV